MTAESEAKYLNKHHPLDDQFIRDLKELRQEMIPKMKVALVRPGAIFHKANEFAAGYDVKAFAMSIEDGYIKFMLGIKTSTPPGYYWELVHRSSNSKFNFILANTKGTIDCDFRGEWQARVKLIPQPTVFYKNHKLTEGEISIQNHIGTQYLQLWEEGEIALQAILHKIPDHQIEFVEESQLSTTERGESGHGSTGNGLGINIPGKVPGTNNQAYC